MKRTNRILSMLFAVIMVVGLLPISTMTAFAAVGDQFVINGIKYEVLTDEGDTGTVEVIVNKSPYYGGDIIIPPTVTNGSSTYTVTSIGEEAFLSATSLTAVTIPNTVISIGDRAFYGCNSLTSMTIPGSVKSFGRRLFYGCDSLQEVTFLSGVPTVGTFMFESCANLTSVIIPESVTSIQIGAFQYCSGLKTITIPASMNSIEQSAFSNCTALTDVYYLGTKAQWDAITIGNLNDKLTDPALHCFWEITLDTQGGEGVPATALTDINGKLPNLPESTKTCYTFDGWYMPDGTTKVTTDTVFANDTTITAKWTECDHAGSTAQPGCENSVTCTICGGTIAATSHSYKDLEHNGTHHWYECFACGEEETDSREAHKGGTATCTAKAKCSVCGEEYGKMLDHKYEWVIDKEPTANEEGSKHEECIVCKAKRNENTAIPKTETNSPQTGDNSNMALWIALLFISGMGVVVTTAMSRKRKTN